MLELSKQLCDTCRNMRRRPQQQRAWQRGRPAHRAARPRERGFRPAPDETVILLPPPASTFSSCFNRNGEGKSAKRQSGQGLVPPRQQAAAVAAAPFAEAAIADCCLAAAPCALCGVLLATRAKCGAFRDLRGGAGRTRAELHPARTF